MRRSSVRLRQAAQPKTGLARTVTGRGLRDARRTYPCGDPSRSPSRIGLRRCWPRSSLISFNPARGDRASFVDEPRFHGLPRRRGGKTGRLRIDRRAVTALYAVPTGFEGDTAPRRSQGRTEWAAGPSGTASSTSPSTCGASPSPPERHASCCRSSKPARERPDGQPQDSDRADGNIIVVNSPVGGDTHARRPSSG